MNLKSFDIPAIFSQAWEVLKKNIKLFIVFPLISAAVIFTLLWLAVALQTIPYAGYALFGILFIACALFAVYVLFVCVKAAIRILNGEAVSMRASLRIDLNEYLKFLETIVIMFVAVIVVYVVTNTLPGKILGRHFITSVLTFILSIAGGSLASVILLPVPFMALENKYEKFWDVFKQSYELTMPKLSQLLIFVWISFAVILIGMIPFGLGFIITLPGILIASAVVYKRQLDVKVSEASTLPL